MIESDSCAGITFDHTLWTDSKFKIPNGFEKQLSCSHTVTTKCEEGSKQAIVLLVLTAIVETDRLEQVKIHFLSLCRQAVLCFFLASAPRKCEK